MATLAKRFHGVADGRRLLATTRALFGGFLALLTACSGGGSGGADVVEPPAKGSFVGAFDVELPGTGPFLLRGSLPLPPGTWKQVDLVEPLVLVDHDGAPRVTQSDVVSRYPNEIDGVDVAHVRAWVTPPPGKQPGDRVSYALTFAPHAAVPAPEVSPVELLSDLPFPATSKVKGLLANASALRVEATDVFGNRYAVRPLDGSGTASLVRHGPVSVEVKVAQTMTPIEVVQGPEGTLPHFLGVHAYLEVSAGSDVVHLDLRVHNAHSGIDDDDPLDDPLGKAYFRELNVAVPNGWAVVQDVDDPNLGAPVSAGGMQVRPLVEPNADGTCHVIPWLGQFHRRLAVAPTLAADQAKAEITGAGLGFARRDLKPDGQPTWSWWNPETARWFPQSQRLPALGHVGAPKIAEKITGELNDIRGHLEAGTSAGGYPVPDGVLGWAHPYGVPYGGMAGGSEIHIFDGVGTVESASTDGYRLARVVHRMHTDRMPNALFDADGEPAHVADWVIEHEGGKDYVPFFHYGKPSLSETDVFGVHEAPKFHVEHVEAAGLAPAYEETLLGYAHHDYQHLIRYTRSAKVLAWLDDDPVAQDDLAMQAANFWMSYHGWYNSAYQHVQSTGYRFDREYVDEYPESGFTFGRGEGWALDATVAAYSTATPEWRARHRPWLDDICDLLGDGQGLCNGFIQSNVNEKFLDGQYRARQMIEQSIVENALVGLLETVYRGEDEGRAALLKDVIVASTRSMISEMAWSPEEDAPWAYTAVGPLEDALPIWCTAEELPADGHSDWTDAYQNWSSFAYGYRLTHDPEFLLFAQKQIGGGELLGELLDDELDNLQNRAALLALVQELSGIW